jgi:Fe-S cluster assembly iron-binding protein IscA
MIINISEPAKKELNNIFKSYSLDTKYLRVYIKEVNA